MNLPDVIARYARRFAAVHRVGHSVSSPLGAWLVLAAAAQAAPVGELRDALEDVLGLDAPAAAAALDDLLREPPSVVTAALAAWGFAGADCLNRLPTAIETGPVPTKHQLDAWAHEHTLGLIDEFPVSDVETLDALLASALATRVSWTDDYELADARELRSPWSTQVTEVLEGDCSAYGGYLAATAQAGTVGVHIATGVHLAPPGVEPAHGDDGSLRVVSVIADAGVDTADVLAAAHDIAIKESYGEVPRISLFDLPLGDGAFWTLTEERRLGGGEHVRAILPAWRATSDHDLTADPELGFGLAGRALLAADDGSSARPIDAFQAAVAGYGQYGFEAAALTGISMGSALPRLAPARVATLRFGQPYAVVAVAYGSDRRDHRWNGIPVFAAWVAEPCEPSEIIAGT